MRFLASFVVAVLLLSFCASANGIEEKIKDEIGVDEIEEIIPESILQNENFSDLQLTYSSAYSDISAKSVFNISIKMFIDGIRAQISFVFLIMSFVLTTSIYKAFSQNIKNSALDECIGIVVSLFLSVILFHNIVSFLGIAEVYISELTGFIRKLLPFFITLICMQGEVAKAATSSAVLVTTITLIESAIHKIVIPLIKVLLGMIVSSYVSKINFLPIIDFISSIVSKLCTITMSVLLAILHFKGTLSKVSDNLALRSVKILAGNFIPIVGGMVSEASATLIAGVRLVKATIGVLGFAIVLYLTLNPIITLILKKLSLKLLSAFSSILGCDDISKNLNSMYGVLNILSAFMISSCIFFVISIAMLIGHGA